LKIRQVYRKGPMLRAKILGEEKGERGGPEAPSGFLRMERELFKEPAKLIPSFLKNSWGQRPGSLSG